MKLNLAAATTASPATGTSVNGATGGAASDELMVSGLLTASASGVALSVTPVPVSAAASGQTYSFVIADASAGGSGNAGVFDGLLQTHQVALSATTDAAGDSYALSTADGGEQLLLDVTAVAAPEPTSLLLAGLGAAPLALGRRRSRRTA